jgi:hypothetical protein
MQLIEEAIDGCWIGHRARTASTEDSGIGSVYSPPHEEHGSPVATRRKYVETVVDIGHRPQVSQLHLAPLLVTLRPRVGFSNTRKVVFVVS